MSGELCRFPKAEYERRARRARELMGRRMDALVVTDPLNYNYFSGAAPATYYARPRLMVLPRGAEPTLVVHRFHEESQRRESWVRDVRIYEPLSRVTPDLLKSVLKEMGLAASRIGFELGFETRLGISYEDFVRLKRALPRARFVDASRVIWGVRMVKSSGEAALIKAACEVTGRAFDACYGSVREGMTEREALEVFFNYHVAGGARPWATINSGPYNYYKVSGGPENRRLERGNTVWIDGGCSYGGYWSDFSRMASVGPPSHKQRRMHSIIRRLTQKALEAVRPGAKASEVSRVCTAECKRLGVDLTFQEVSGRLGHGVGMMLTEPPHIAPYDHTPLREGMILSVEPGTITDYGCFHVEQMVVVTKDGCEVLSVASDDLRTIPLLS